MTDICPDNSAINYVILCVTALNVGISILKPILLNNKYLKPISNAILNLTSNVAPNEEAAKKIDIESNQVKHIDIESPALKKLDIESIVLKPTS
jgi:hypothetical protein